MATAVGTLQSSLQRSATALSGHDSLINRKKLHLKQRTRLACSPTCILQIGMDDAVHQAQRIQFDPLFNKKIRRDYNFEALTQERRQDLDVENAKRWSTEGEYLRRSRVRAELVNLATLASDRTETHGTSAATEEDNWKFLIHSTISLTSVLSASAAAMNGAGHQAPGLCVGASILGLGTAAAMALVSKFQQPSQFAEEEQRQASGLFRRLTVEVEATLDDCPNCSEATSPNSIRLEPLQQQPLNRWTSEIEEQMMMRVTSLLQSSDIPNSAEAAEKVKHMNKLVAVASPVLALTGSFLNVMPGMVDIQGAGAAIMVCGLFVHSLSNGLQLGALYENHKNIAGYHGDADRSMESSLRVPVEERQDGRLFLERIALQLGRDSSESSVSPRVQEKAGMMF